MKTYREIITFFVVFLLLYAELTGAGLDGVIRVDDGFGHVVGEYQVGQPVQGKISPPGIYASVGADIPCASPAYVLHIDNKGAIDFRGSDCLSEIYLTDDQIRFVAESGQVCRVMGHRWESVPTTTLIYRADGNYPQTRECSLCKKYESLCMGEWK